VFNNKIVWRRTGAIAAAGAVVLGAAGCAGGTTTGSGDGSIPVTSLQLAVFNSPQTPYGGAIQWFVDEAAERSDGAIEIEVFWEGALLAGPDVLTGLAEGRADLGFGTPLYSPAELPLSQIATVPFISSDVVAVQNAFTELYETNADYKAEWERVGVLPLTVQGITPMVLAGADVPADLDWIDGRQIRASGLTANAIQDAGGNAVALVVSEIYESAQRGLIDGVAAQNLGQLPSISLQEIMPHLADPGTGVYTTTYLAANPSKWNSLDPAAREVLDEVIAEFNDVYLEQVAIYDESSCDAFLEAGGSATVWDESETEKWSDLVGDSLLKQWKAGVAPSGADADSFYDEYMALIDEPSDAEYIDGMAACAERSN
jgi:TRAP-type C4-dicarboxylate transport system substrate-binding protein